VKISNSLQNNASRGFSAIEVAIFMVAAMVVATVTTAAMLTLGNDAAQAGAEVSDDGVNAATGSLQLRGPVTAIRGSVDVDANDVIDLAGSDIQAVTKLTMLLTADMANGIDLTPPYTADDTGTDPDFYGSQNSTVISVVTENFSAPAAAWSVTFPGSDDGDFILENGERAELTVWLLPLDVANRWYDLGSGSSDSYVDASSEALVGKDQLTLRITSSRGAETVIQRTLPIELTPVILLD
jgi:archaellin